MAGDFFVFWLTAGEKVQTARLIERKKKVPFGYFFQFYVLRGRRTRGVPGRTPLVNHLAHKSHVGTRPCGLKHTAVGKDQVFAVLQIQVRRKPAQTGCMPRKMRYFSCQAT